MKKYRDVKFLKRRIFALTLAVVMILSCLPNSFISLAAEGDESQEVEPQTAQEQPLSEEESQENTVNLQEVVVTPEHIIADMEDDNATHGITCTLPENFDGTVTYASDDETLATVDETGEITLLGKSGKCTVTVTITRGEEMVERTVEVWALQSQFVQEASCEYTGEAVEKPVAVFCGDTQLVQDTDYTLSYSNNTEVTTKDSKARVMITGVGDYEGYTTTREFDIAEKETPDKEESPKVQTKSIVKGAASDPIDINSEVYEIQVDPSTVTYTGNINKPQVSFYDFDGHELVDYKDNCLISYDNATDAGTATITVKGNPAKNYTGTKQVTFEIEQRPVSECDIYVTDGETQIYPGDGQPFKPAFEVYYDDNLLTEGVDYRSIYLQNTGVGTMYIHIEGMNNFGASYDKAVKLIGDFEKNSKVKLGGSATATYKNGVYATGYSIEYSGLPKTPSVKISLGGQDLKEGQDYYVVDYDHDENGADINHTDASDNVKVVIRGKGLYEGKKIIATYTIAKRSIAGPGFTFSIDNPKAKKYTGSAITFDVAEEQVSVKLGNTKSLEYSPDQSKDFYLEYENNVNAGRATVKAVGSNNYTGTISKEFIIAQKPLTELDSVRIEGVSDKVYSEGEISFPNAKVMYLKNGTPTELEKESYVLSYSNYDKISNAENGKARAIATGQGNYTGEITLDFNILPKSFSGVSFTLGGKTVVATDSDLKDGYYEVESGYTVVYDGTEKKLDKLGFSVSDNGQDLAGWSQINYELVSEGNVSTDLTNAGRKYVSVTGLNQYDGQKARVYFTILPKIFGDNIIIDSIDAAQTYTGSAVCPSPAVRDGSTLLTAGKDYELTYKNNIAAAPANGTNPPTVIVTGKGNYETTSKSITFTIGDDLSGAEVSVSEGTWKDDHFEILYRGAYLPDFNLTLNGNPVNSADYTVTSDMPAEGAGTNTLVKVTCTGKNRYYGTKVFWYKVNQANLDNATVTNLSNNGSFDYIYCKRRVPMELAVKYNVAGKGDVTLVEGRDFTISGDYSNKTVNGDKGVHSITLEGKGNYTGSKTVDYEVKVGDISKANYRPIAPKEYTGSEIKPWQDIYITDKDTGEVLTVGVDYFIMDYENNINKGEATIVIQGNGGYEGTLRIPFDIKAIDISTAELKINQMNNLKYTGSEITQDVKVTCNGVVLNSGIDYTVDYSNKIWLGDVDITITGQGNYSGSKTLNGTYKIIGDITDTDLFTITISRDANKQFWLNDSGQINTGQVTVEYKDKGEYVKGDQFEVITENCTTPGKGRITVKGCNDNSGEKTFDVDVLCNLETNSRISVEGLRENYDYTGDSIEPRCTVVYTTSEDKRVVLRKGTDYTLSYENNLDVGTGATIHITGCGSYYKNTRSQSFGIVYNLETANVTGVDSSYDYTGSAITPKPVVTCGRTNTQLTEGDQYRVTYENNVMAGQAKVIITSIAYSDTIGSWEKTFDINPLSIEGPKASVTYDGKAWNSIGSKEYTGEDITPEVRVVYDGNELVEGTDYIVGYQNNRNVSDVAQAVVTVKGQGNYTGTVSSGPFLIEPCDFTSGKVTAQVASAVYSGKDKDVVPQSYQLLLQLPSSGTKSLVEGTDYEVKNIVKDPIDSTKATITFEGKKNFIGELSAQFSIVPANLGSGNIQISQDEIPYTGRSVTLDELKVMLNLSVTCPVGQNGNYILDPASEYDIAIAEGEPILDAGIYTIVVSGKNGFTGELRRRVTVTRKSIDHATIEVDDIADQEDYESGIKYEPSVTVTDRDRDVVLGDGDYSVSYRNNSTSGKATVVITGKGNYEGTRYEYFYIGKCITDKCIVSVEAGQQGTFTYNGTPQIPGLKVVYRKDAGSTPVILVQGKDYEIADSDDNGVVYDYINAGNKDILIRGIGSYYGEVLSINLYEIAQKVAQPEKIRVVLDLPTNNETGDYEICYSGQAIEPKVHVYDGDISEKTELNALDYEVVYDNNLNVGRANVTVKLRRNYESGTEKRIQFFIVKQSIDDASVELNKTRVHYTGGEICPTATVISSEGKTIPVEAYEVVYQDNVCAGEAKAIIRAKDDSNYSGTISAKFVIYASLASGVDTTISEIGTQFYTDIMGEMPRPVPQIVCGGRNLVVGQDVDVTYSYVDGDKSKGKISIVSKKEDYYIDSAERTYDIGMDTSVLNITGYANTYTYTGKSIRPQFAITTPSGEVLTYNQGEVTYTNQTPGGTLVGDTVNVGKVTAQIPLYLDGVALTVGGKHTVATVTYTIEPKAITSCNIVGIYNDTYTGKQLTPPVTILYNGEELVVGRDYTISYQNNVNPGLASVDVVGRGNYSGKDTLHFTIKAANIVNLTAKPASSTSISLRWTKSAKVSGYQIYSGDGKKLYGTTSGKTFTVKKLKVAKNYSFKVRSYVTAGGKTTYGAFKSVSTNTKVTSVAVKVSSPKKSRAKLTWSTKSSVDGFEIYRSTKSGGKYTKVASIPKNKKSYTDKGLKSGKKYYYKVRAYKKMNGKYQYGDYKKVKVTVK